MKHLSRVVWAEGMYIDQHHFQAQSRFFEESIAFAVSSLAPNGFGLLVCRFDIDALRNGNLTLIQARGVLPSGMPFDTDHDAIPPSRNLNEIYKPSGGGMEVCLGAPVRKAGGNIEPEKPRDDKNEQLPQVRFRAETYPVADEMLARDEVQVVFGRKNLVLLTATEAAEKDDNGRPLWDCLSVARIIRDSSGVFAFDKKCVPVCLRVSASPRLTSILEFLIKGLGERTGTAAPKTSGHTGGLSERDTMKFWFLHTINSSAARLKHLTAPRCHPETLYLEMARIAGALCTFVIDSTPATLPVYDHLRPGASLLDLDRRIRDALSIVFPPESKRLPLTRVEDQFWGATIEDSRLFTKTQWFLGVRSQAAEADVIAQVPAVAKICSTAWVSKLVERGVAGLELKYVVSPPPPCSPEEGYRYFSIEQSGKCWQHMTRTHSIGVYVPATLPMPDLEVVAVFD